MPIIPPYLSAGSVIGLVAPARKVSPEEMAPAVALLENAGFQVRLAPHLYGAFHQFSGSEEERIADLQAMLDDTEVNAILAARGGYGTLQLIDKLDFTLFKKHPKWIAGYSDITVLHSHLHSVLDIASLHATMPINFPTHIPSVETLIQALKGESLYYEAPPHALNKKGIASGVLVGGNISLLYALQGSVSDIQTEGKILFLEDLDEYLYHIDRMMRSLDRSGKLRNLSGLVIGSLSDMKDHSIPFGKSAEEIIHTITKDYPYPVCFGFPAGHSIENRALPFGKYAELEVSEAGIGLRIL